MTDAALGQFRLILRVAFLTQGMCRIFKGVDLLRHAGLTVVTGFAFFYFLPLDISNLFAVRSLAVVTDTAFQTTLMRCMWELDRLRRASRVNSGLKSNFCRAFVGSACQANITDRAATKQESAAHQQSFHYTPPLDSLDNHKLRLKGLNKGRSDKSNDQSSACRITAKPLNTAHTASSYSSEIL
jgi:hypothetical protein